MSARRCPSRCRLAPRVASSRMMLSSAEATLRCSAVCPFSSTALTSAPRSRHRETASSACCSEPRFGVPRNPLRRLAAYISARLLRLRSRVDVGAVVEQQPHHGDVGILGGAHQRRGAFGEARYRRRCARARAPAPSDVAFGLAPCASSTPTRPAASSLPCGLGFGRPTVSSSVSCRPPRRAPPCPSRRRRSGRRPSRAAAAPDRSGR